MLEQLNDEFEKYAPWLVEAVHVAGTFPTTPTAL
jgi:hypothetical protein